ncbi:hypothetical protein GCM10010507_07120 [Streptomyces cinnamoneus]|uniref:Uncharacterized protein n=1 Tax=Streptomyces cinnamoneus TaxID=53446 RepID=A0A918T9R9_STRCJ|nr:hypothetical protein GCM10010507_07120 [Streptomyces cinnamoneus]
MWMSGPSLWRTALNLCTGRGKALWTNTQSPAPHASDLQFCHPPAVEEKNFPTRPAIATNGAEKITHNPVK